MLSNLIRLRSKARGEKGYTLLEYCAGAAIITGIIYGAMVTMGGNIGGLLTAVGSWATTRAGEVTP
jgi:hypothetical protein